MRKQVGAAPANTTDAVTKAYVDSHDMGPGGAIGAPLLKNSATDYDDKWGTGFETVHYSSAAINVNDAVTTYPFGITQNFLSNTQAQSGGWPCANNYCQIVTMKTQDPAGFASSQFVMSDTNAVQFCYYRSGNNSGWSAWVNLGTDCGTASGTCDSNGYLTVTHGLNYTPQQVFVTPYPTAALTSVAGSNPTVDTITSTTFRVRLATAVVVSGQSGVFGLSWIANTTRFFWQAFR